MTNHTMREITYREAIDFLLPRHYSGRKPNIKHSFGLFSDAGTLVAVCTYGIPASNSLCIGVLGREYAKNVIELNRLCREESYKGYLSEFVSWTLRAISAHNYVVVSYADTAMRHFGSIYQACNFIYTGATKQRTDKYAGNNKHSRHYEGCDTSKRVVRSSKHRYIYFACDKRTKAIYRSNLRYDILPYPKGDTLHYELGFVLEQKIIDSVK